MTTPPHSGSGDERPDYRTFDIRGSHAHIGYELGRADPPFSMQFWWAPPPPARFAAACRDVVHALHPHLIDEFDAYADAQRLPARELWPMSCRVHLKARVRPEHLRAAGAGIEIAKGCSTFAWLGVQAPSSAATTTTCLIKRAANASALRPIAAPTPASARAAARRRGRYDGMNEHGLFVSLHVVMTDTPGQDEVRPGVPFHLVARLALELCSTAREAADLLVRLPHLSSPNYLVADAHDAIVIEADPRRVRALPREGDLVAATNHYRHPDMRPLQGARAFTNSACRLAYMMRESNWAGGGDKAPSPGSPLGTLARAERIMADRSAPMCGLSGALTTLWSCVADLGARRIRYAPGPPSDTPYEELTAWS